MNALGVICDGFKKVFCGNNVLLKHISLFALTGIISVASVQCQIVSEQMKVTKQMPDLSGIVIGLIVVIIGGIYLGGYALKFMNNVFHNDELPEIGIEHFGIFFSALPLYFVWFLWMMLVFLLALIPVIGWIALLVLLFIWFPFIQFVYSAFAKDFESRGLFNIMLPFKYMKLSIGIVLLLGLLFIPIYIVSMIPSFIVGLFAGLSGADSQNAIYLGGLLGGYFGFVIQLVWNYCIVRIYAEKIEPYID